MTTDLPTAFPLQWPISRPRCDTRRKANFKTAAARRPHSISEGIYFVVQELRRMGADDWVVSSNLRLRVDGYPASDQRSPADPGVAVYFHHDDRPVAFACDTWERVEDNLWAIGLTIEALRGVDRWGAATLEATFTGYLAIEAPAASKWFEVLGVPANATSGEIRAAYRGLVKHNHPDSGAGALSDSFIRVQQAYETAERMGLV